jgi:carbonic anhydrase
VQDSGRTTRRAALGLGVLAGVGALVGCGSSDETTATERGTPAKVTAKHAAATGTAAAAEPTVTNPAEAIARLKEGAARFASGGVNHPDQSVSYRTSLAKGQHPFAVVLSCADSRVPPEIVFDQGLGDLFVCRTAGQVVDNAVLGSIQYGIAELKIPLIVVLGHEKCGAVKATVEAVEKKSGKMGNDIDALVAAIKPAVLAAEKTEPKDLVDAAVRLNAKSIAAGLSKKPVLSAAVKAGSLKVVGARYDLDEGKVAFI